MGILPPLTEHPRAPDIDPVEARRFLDEAKEAVAEIPRMSRHFGGVYEVPGIIAYDKSLTGKPVYGWHLSVRDVARLYPELREELYRETGGKPVVAFNPDLLRLMKRGYRKLPKAVIKHEVAMHSAQNDKAMLKSLSYLTKIDDDIVAVPVGEWLLEGSGERALRLEYKAKGLDAPSAYMDEMSGGRTTYSIYHQFVNDLEALEPGITRQVFRAMRRGGYLAAVRLLDKPEIRSLTERYALMLRNPRQKRVLH